MVTHRRAKGLSGNSRCFSDLRWWAHLDSNQGPTDYEGLEMGRRFKLF